MADITVQVSSAGLTAYGALAYGKNTYGGEGSPIFKHKTLKLTTYLGGEVSLGVMLNGVILMT
jgi:hypothetical protein